MVTEILKLCSNVRFLNLVEIYFGDKLAFIDNPLFHFQKVNVFLTLALSFFLGCFVIMIFHICYSVIIINYAEIFCVLDLRVWFHCGEKKYVAYARLICEEHYKSVKTESKSARWGQTVFQSGYEILVNLRVVSALSALCGNLLYKTLFLVNRVVEFRERVAEFRTVYEILKTFRKRGAFWFAFSKRRVFNGIIVNDCRLNKLVLNKRLKERDKYIALC